MRNYFRQKNHQVCINKGENNLTNMCDTGNNVLQYTVTGETRNICEICRRLIQDRAKYVEGSDVVIRRKKNHKTDSDVRKDQMLFESSSYPKTKIYQKSTSWNLKLLLVCLYIMFDMFVHCDVFFLIL